MENFTAKINWIISQPKLSGGFHSSSWVENFTAQINWSISQLNLTGIFHSQDLGGYFTAQNKCRLSQLKLSRGFQSQVNQWSATWRISQSSVGANCDSELVLLLQLPTQTYFWVGLQRSTEVNRGLQVYRFTEALHNRFSGCRSCHTCRSWCCRGFA